MDGYSDPDWPASTKKAIKKEKEKTLTGMITYLNRSAVAVGNRCDKCQMKSAKRIQYVTTD